VLIHTHDRAERLEPKGMRKPLNKSVAPIMMHDRFGNDRTQGRHVLSQPSRGYGLAWRGESALPVRLAIETFVRKT
jgi:hypothetical protein